MGYAASAWERAMTVQEVVLKALSGEIHWFRAADILGMSARTLRRWRERYEEYGYVGLVDKRRQIAFALNDLAIVLTDQRRCADAEPLYRQALAMFQKVKDSDPASSAWSLHGLGDVHVPRTDRRG